MKRLFGIAVLVMMTIGLAPYTAISQSEFAPDELLYLGNTEMLANLSSWSSSKLMELTEDPDFTDGDWVRDVYAQMIFSQGLYESFIELEPTPRLQPLHDELLVSYRESMISNELFYESALTLDVDLLESSIQHRNSATEATQRATAIIEDLTDESLGR